MAGVRGVARAVEPRVRLIIANRANREAGKMPGPKAQAQLEGRKAEIIGKSVSSKCRKLKLASKLTDQPASAEMGAE